MSSSDLERIVGAALVRLQPPRAPHTLLPRVLAAVRQTQQRWSVRGWSGWPLGWRLASCALFAAAVVLGIAIAPAARAALADGWTWLQMEVPGPIAGVEWALALATQVSAAFDVAAIVWRTLLVRIVAGAALLAMLMCLACLALASAVQHVAFRKVHST
jgi:hypothetical protein